MPISHALNEYHVLSTVRNEPTLMHIFARNKSEALTLASHKGTNLLVLFATRTIKTY